MTNLFAKKHLRLVSNEAHSKLDPTPSFSQVTEAEHQKTHDRKISLFFLSEVDVLREANFTSFLFENFARIFFDVRVAPRLDFIAPNRSLAFRKFTDLDVDYVDIVGAIGVASDVLKSSMPEDWADLVACKINALETMSCSVFFLFDNDNVLRKAHNMLPSVIERSIENGPLTVKVHTELFCEKIAM